MALRSLGLAILTLISLTSAAQTQPTTPTTTTPTFSLMTGISGYVTTGTQATVYGAFAGTTGNCSAELPCDTCAAPPSCGSAPLCACNTQSVTGNVVVHISLTNVNGAAACAAVQSSTGTATTQLLTQQGPFDPSHVDFLWDDFCLKMAGSNCASIAAGGVAGNPNSQATVIVWESKSVCNGTGPNSAGGDSTSIQFTFKIVTPPTDSFDFYNEVQGNDGIYGFRPYPGDEQIYMEDLKATQSFPVLGQLGVSATQLVVFFSKDSIDTANYSQSPFKPVFLDFTDASATDLATNVVDGLDNDTPYYFRIALKDAAGDVLQYFPGDPDTPADCKAGAANPQTCIYAATPSKVLGLLSKDLNCFVATAAYGSALEPKIQTFREFRHKFLLTNPWGLEFVRSYYHYGPLAARWISDKPVARFFARAVLWPLWGFSALAVQFGFTNALIASLLLLTSLTTLLWYGLRRVKPRA